MAGRKRKKSLTPEQRKRLEKLYRLQVAYRGNGHDVTPVDGEIAELEAIKEGGQVKPSEVKK